VAIPNRSSGSGSETVSRRPRNSATGNPACAATDPKRTRRWEYAGRKASASLPHPNDPDEYLNNPAPFNASAAMFHAWTGGRGFTDCEPLLREFVVGKQYGVFATFGLNNTYPRLLKAQVKDSP